MSIIKKGLKVLHEEGLIVFIKNTSFYIFRKIIDLSGLGYIISYFIINLPLYPTPYDQEPKAKKINRYRQ